MVRDVLAHMQDALAAVVSLLLVFHSFQDAVNQGGHRRTVNAGPAPVISTVMSIQLLVVNMLRRHMTFIGNVQRELLVGTGVFTE